MRISASVAVPAMMRFVLRKMSREMRAASRAQNTESGTSMGVQRKAYRSKDRRVMTVTECQLGASWLPNHLSGVAPMKIQVWGST